MQTHGLEVSPFMFGHFGISCEPSVSLVSLVHSSVTCILQRLFPFSFLDDNNFHPLSTGERKDQKQQERGTVVASFLEQKIQ